MNEVRGFTSNETVQTSGLTRRQLQLFAAKTAVPIRKGRPGPGCQDLYSVRQVIALAFAKHLIDAGFTTAHQAVSWLSRQNPRHLAKHFAEGQTTLLVPINGQPDIFEAAIGPRTSRSLKLFLSQLDLAKSCRRTLKRAIELGLPLAREESELAEQLGLERKVAEKRSQRTQRG